MAPRPVLQLYADLMYLDYVLQVTGRSGKLVPEQRLCNSVFVTAALLACRAASFDGL